MSPERLTSDPTRADQGDRQGREPGTDATSLLARLPGTAAFELEVTQTSAVSASMHRVRFRGSKLAELEYLPGQDLMFAVPGADGRLFRRRYTIRRLDRAAGLLDVEVVLHGDGPGARWFSAAKAGDQIEAIGPRGKITVDPDARWHLFTAEESAIAATLTMIEALGAGCTATALVEVGGPEDEQPVVAPPEVELHLTWLHRKGAEPGTSQTLVDAVNDLSLPRGPGHAYVNGELHIANTVREVLKSRGLTDDQLSVKPYWRRGVANAPHGEPVRD